MPARPRKRVRRRRNTEQFDSSSSESHASDESKQSKQTVASNKEHVASGKSAGSDSESSSSSGQSSSSSASGASVDRPTAKRGRLAKKKKQDTQQTHPNVTKQQQLDHQQQDLVEHRSPSPVHAPSPLPPTTTRFYDEEGGDTDFLAGFSIPEFKLPPKKTTPRDDNDMDREHAGTGDSNPTEGGKTKERLDSVRTTLKEDEERFKEWYMKTIVDRFPNELDQLRATSKKSSSSDLESIINSIAAGLDLFKDASPAANHQHQHSDLSLVLDSIPTQQPS